VTFINHNHIRHARGTYTVSLKKKQNVLFFTIVMLLGDVFPG